MKMLQKIIENLSVSCQLVLLHNTTTTNLSRKCNTRCCCIQLPPSRRSSVSRSDRRHQARGAPTATSPWACRRATTTSSDTPRTATRRRDTRTSSRAAAAGQSTHLAPTSGWTNTNCDISIKFPRWFLVAIQMKQDDNVTNYVVVAHGILQFFK